MTAAGLPGLAALAVGCLAFLIALLAARLRRDRGGEAGARKSWRSILGIVLQAAAFAAVGMGAVYVSLNPLGMAALVEATAVALLLAAGATLFVAATRAMGANWSLVARTRADHHLVVTGPFAWVRHPIYVALALALLAIAVALGHARGLLVGVPLYAAGTWARVGEEERLLREAFGASYDEYARRVKRFVPNVF